MKKKKASKKVKTKQYFGMTVKDTPKPSLNVDKLPHDPNPEMMPTRITGVLLPLKVNPKRNVWRIIECTGKQTEFTLATYEKAVISRIIKSCKRCKEVRVTIKNGRLMGLTFNEYGDGRLS